MSKVDTLFNLWCRDRRNRPSASMEVCRYWAQPAGARHGVVLITSTLWCWQLRTTRNAKCEPQNLAVLSDLIAQARPGVADLSGSCEIKNGVSEMRLWLQTRSPFDRLVRKGHPGATRRIDIYGKQRDPTGDDMNRTNPSETENP